MVRTPRDVHALFLAGGALLAGCSGPPQGARLGDDGAPIVDGTIASGDPAVVFLWMGGGSCSGTLISPKVVLTAAHCVQGVSAGGTEVFFGNDANGPGEWLQAVDLDAHPSGDIAAITMASPGPTKPIPIYGQALVAADEGRSVRIVGFGVTSEYGSDSGLKREGISKLYDWDSDFLYIGATGSSTCYGDSGGPAFFDVGGVEHVAGVTSFGTDACGYGLSGETRVDAFYEWVTDYVDTHDPATCGADSRCASGCTAPDPDCPCAGDGFCTAACTTIASDPDCAGCAPDGTCRVDCPSIDQDCCGADGDCTAACGNVDPDCGAGDSDGDGDGTGSGDPDDDDDRPDAEDDAGDSVRSNGPMSGQVGGCATSTGAPGGAAWLLLGVALIRALGRTRLPR